MRKNETGIAKAEIVAVCGDEPQVSVVFFSDNNSTFGRKYTEAINSPWFHVALLFHPGGAHYSGYYFECTSGVFHPNKPSGWIGPQYAAALNAWLAADYRTRMLSFRNLRLAPAEFRACLAKSLLALGRIRYAELSLLRLALREKLGIKIPCLGRTPHWCTCSEAVTLMLPPRLHRLLGVDRHNTPDNVYPSGRKTKSLWTLCDRIDSDAPPA